MSESTQQIAELRNEVSAIINTLGPNALLSSREVSLAKTDAQRAFHHLGLHLKNTGGTNPYPEANNPESKVIEPVKDASDMWILLEGETQLERVKELRGHIDTLVGRYDAMNVPTTVPMFANFHESKKWLIEVKMWLGWELGRIRDRRTLEESGQEMGHSPGLDIKLY